MFAVVFGLTLTFNYRALTIKVVSDFELPVLKQLRIEKMRSNLSGVKSEPVADSSLGRTFHLFKFGTLDYSVSCIQAWNGPADNHLTIAAGTEFLFGEADLSFTYYSEQQFNMHQLKYLWRWIDNRNPVIKQAQIGYIPVQSIAFINAPVVGAVIRNSPTTIRKATGYYIINEFTEPDWTVELYLNNTLMGYTKADASGAFMFKVPLLYGYNTLKLKYYSQMGEERTEERTMNVPYTIMAAGELEYSVSAGIVEDGRCSRFGQVKLNWGVNRFITAGGGLEYLSSISNGAFIPFATATIQPFRKFIATVEYSYNVKTRGLLDYYFWKNLYVEVDYTRYVRGQLAIPVIFLENRKATLCVPFLFRNISGYANVTFTRLVYPGFNYNYTYIRLSANYKRFCLNSSTQFNWTDHSSKYITSDVTLSCRLNKGYTIQGSAQSDISENILLSYKATVGKKIPKGYFSASYERNVLNHDNIFSLSIIYNLPFVQTNISTACGGGEFSTCESLEGSMAFDGDKKDIHASNNSSVGKGGIALYPFLDLNRNGIFDPGEPMVRIKSVLLMGSIVSLQDNDSIIRIPDLSSFTCYLVEFDDRDLDNITWRFKKKTYSVLIDPNQFKRVDIPVVVMGEVTGMAYADETHNRKGIGRIIVKFYRKNNAKAVANTMSESDGYIDFMGLEPGEYSACVDSAQLRDLDFTSDPIQREFTIKTLEQGDIVEGLDFVLSKRKEEEIPKTDPATIEKYPQKRSEDGSPSKLKDTPQKH
jgi:hypothetical protein